MRYSIGLVFLILLSFFVSTLVLAEEEYIEHIGYASGDVFNSDIHVLDVVTLAGDTVKIGLWGVQKVDFGSPVFELKARSLLEQHIAGQAVTCVLKNAVDSVYKGQCVNAAEDDLSLFLLQNGLVIVDRSEIFSTVYEQPYIEAENLAQSAEVGIWASDEVSIPSSLSVSSSREFLRGAFFLICPFIVSIMLITFYIMRGFGRVVDLQNQSIGLAAKERDLREREKNVIASIIHSEIRENKPKIEAYLTVYEEMYAEAMASEEPAFMKTGEVVQRQPSLSRSVYDGNTGTLNVLGARMASEIIHYYARIKTTPDYVEIGPDMPIEKVREIIKNSIDHAKKLDLISTKLLEFFCSSHMIEDL